MDDSGQTAYLLFFHRYDFGKLVALAIEKDQVENTVGHSTTGGDPLAEAETILSRHSLQGSGYLEHVSTYRAEG